MFKFEPLCSKDFYCFAVQIKTHAWTREASVLGDFYERFIIEEFIAKNVDQVGRKAELFEPFDELSALGGGWWRIVRGNAVVGGRQGVDIVGIDETYLFLTTPFGMGK